MRALRLLALIQLVFCWSANSAPPVSARPKPIYKDCKGPRDYSDKNIPNKSWSALYDTWLEQSLKSPTGKVLIQTRWKDAPRVCPNFPKLSSSQRIEFYQTFAAALAEAESGFDNESFWHEKWGDKTYGYSVGLFQLSTEDSYQFGCKFSKPDNCAPTNQMESIDCVVRILALQMNLCGTILQGVPESTDCMGQTAHTDSPNSSFYFSTLNPKDPYDGGAGFALFNKIWIRRTGWDFTKSGLVKPPNQVDFCYK